MEESLGRPLSASVREQMLEEMSGPSPSGYRTVLGGNDYGNDQYYGDYEYGDSDSIAKDAYANSHQPPPPIPQMPSNQGIPAGATRHTSVGLGPMPTVYDTGPLPYLEGKYK
jgi:hypothetical protein